MKNNESLFKEMLEALEVLEGQVFELGLSRLTEDQRNTCAKAGIQARKVIARARKGIIRSKRCACGLPFGHILPH